MSKSIEKKGTKVRASDAHGEEPNQEFWQRQSDIDRFVNETRTRKMIQEVCLPMLENQKSLQAKLSGDVDKTLNELSDRLDRAEYALYRSDKADTRFDKIYSRLENLEITHKKDSLFVQEQAKVLDQKLADDRFTFQT